MSVQYIVIFVHFRWVVQAADETVCGGYWTMGQIYTNHAWVLCSSAPVDWWINFPLLTLYNFFLLQRRMMEEALKQSVKRTWRPCTRLWGELGKGRPGWLVWRWTWLTFWLGEGYFFLPIQGLQSSSSFLLWVKDYYKKCNFWVQFVTNL